MKKLFFALWFSIISTFVYLLLFRSIFHIKVINENSRLDFMASVLLNACTYPKLLAVLTITCFFFGYIFGPSIKFDKNVLLNGLLNTLFVGFVISLLTTLTVSIHLLLELTLSIFLFIIFEKIYYLGLIILSVNIVGAVAIWLFLGVFNQEKVISGQDKC